MLRGQGEQGDRPGEQRGLWGPRKENEAFEGSGLLLQRALIWVEVSLGPQ